MVKKRVTLSIRADLAHDLERLGNDAVASEKLIEAIEIKMRKWLKANKPKFSHIQSASLEMDVSNSPPHTRVISTKRQKFREFGKLISQTRQSIGLVSAEAAKELGWTHEFMVSVERGHRLLSFHKLIKFTQTLNISAEQTAFLREKLKELAPFVTRVNVPTVKKTSANSIKDLGANVSEHCSEPENNGACSDAIKKSNNRINTLAKPWCSKGETPPNLSALSFAILNSAGANNERNSDSFQTLTEQHPQILEERDSVGAYYESTAAARDRQKDVEAQKEEAVNNFFGALGIVIKSLRMGLKLTRNELAARTNLDSKKIRNLEIGKGMSVEEMFKVAEALDLKPGQLAQQAQKHLPADYQVH